MSTALRAYPQRYFDAWNQRDLDVAVEVIAPTVDWRDPSLPAPLTDHEGVRGFFGMSWQAFPDIHFAPVGEPLVGDDGTVAQQWLMTGTHTGDGFPPGVPATGHSFSVPGMDIWSVDADGRATVVRAYYDAADLARQLGLA